MSYIAESWPWRDVKVAYPAMIKSPISKKEGYALHEDTVVSFLHPRQEFD